MFRYAIILTLLISGFAKASSQTTTLQSPSALYRDLTPTEAPILEEQPPKVEAETPKPKSENAKSSASALPPLPANEPLSDWAKDALLELPQNDSEREPASASKKNTPKRNKPASSEKEPN